MFDAGNGDAVVGTEVRHGLHGGVAGDQRDQLPAESGQHLGATIGLVPQHQQARDGAADHIQLAGQQRVGGNDGAVQRLPGDAYAGEPEGGGVFLDQAALPRDLIGEEAEALQIGNPKLFAFARGQRGGPEQAGDDSGAASDWHGRPPCWETDYTGCGRWGRERQPPPLRGQAFRVSSLRRHRSWQGRIVRACSRMS